MRKLLASLALSTLCALASAQVKLALMIQGQRVGTGSFNRSITPGGGVKLNLGIKIDVQGAKASYSLESQFDKSGRPVREVISESQNGSSKKTVTSYGPASVTITSTQGGKTKTKKVAIPKGRNIKSKSQHWLVTNQPKPGEKDTWFNLSHETFKWEAESATYVGKEQVNVGGRKVMGHKVKHTKGTAWYDDKGLPWRLEIQVDPGQVMVLERA